MWPKSIPLNQRPTGDPFDSSVEMATENDDQLVHALSNESGGFVDALVLVPIIGNGTRQNPWRPDLPSGLKRVSVKYYSGKSLGLAYVRATRAQLTNIADRPDTVVFSDLDTPIRQSKVGRLVGYLNSHGLQTNMVSQAAAKDILHASLVANGEKPEPGQIKLGNRVF